MASLKQKIIIARDRSVTWITVATVTPLYVQKLVAFLGGRA